MHPEPHFCRRGNELCRTHWTHGVFVAEAWAAGAWHAVSDADYVTHKSVAISRHAAVEMIERSHGTPPAPSD